MKTTNYFLIFLLVFTAFAVSSCSKDGGEDEGDQTEDQNVPQSKAEAEAKIEGKWNMSGSGEVRSVEFLTDGTYILEVSAGSDLLPAAHKPQGRSFVARGGQRAAQAGATGTVSTTGTYTVSPDGKTITLDGIATITITALTADSFSFSITFTEGNKTVDVSLNVAPTVAASDKTNLLARTWKHRNWPFGWFSQQDITELTKLGLKLEDLKVIFTKSGTFILHSPDWGVATSPIPEDPSQPTPPDQYVFYGIEHVFARWEWKDSQQDAIKLSVSYSDGHSYTVDVSISELTANSLKFPEFIGDYDGLDLVPR